MERVRKFGIWTRSELAIGHDVRRAFRTGDIRTWGRNRAVKPTGLSIRKPSCLVVPHDFNFRSAQILEHAFDVKLCECTLKIIPARR